MYFETGADCLRGMMSPGNIVSGHVVSGAGCLRGMLSPGAGCLRGRLSPGRIVSGADCLGAYCLRGTLSPGRIVLGHIVSGHIVSGRIVSGHHVPPPISIVSKPQLNHNSTQPNITQSCWVRHENDICPGHIYPGDICPYLNISNISAVTDPILMKL